MNAIVAWTVKQLPPLPIDFISGDQVVKIAEPVCEIRKDIIGAVDCWLGQVLTQAKKQLPHGEFLYACKRLGYSKVDSSRLRRWYEEVKGTESVRFDPAAAEQKMSRHAREAFCRAEPEVKAVVIQDITNPEVSKITAADIKRMSPARELQPGEQTHPDYNKIIQLFEQINDLTHANEFSDNFSREEWFSILGSWQGAGTCIRSKCDYIRRHESNREDAVDVECTET
jgi:hypothetical protein